MYPMLQPVKDALSYHTLARATLSRLQEKLDNEYGTVEHNNNVLGYNVDGVGEYVVSRQPSVHEMWVSSPLSGPCKFVIKNGRFVEKKKGDELFRYFDRELESIRNIVKKRNG